MHVLSDGLHVCRGCSSTLVEPVRWDPVGRTRWALTLRCPECQWWTTGVWCDEEIERLEVVLSQAEASMVADCEALAQATIDEEIEQFARALERDEITPSDF